MNIDITDFDSESLEQPGVKKPIFILTQKDRSDLSRVLVTTNGQVLCKCDGTSNEVRSCLRSTDPRFSGIDDMQMKDDRFTGDEKYHLLIVNSCGQKGLTRLAILTDPEKR